MFVQALLRTPIEWLVVAILAAIGCVYAIRSIIHAVRMRSDAFEFNGRVSKTGWVAMLVASALALALTVVTMGVGGMFTLAIIAWVVVGVYWGSKRVELDELIANSQDGYGNSAW